MVRMFLDAGSDPKMLRGILNYTMLRKETHAQSENQTKIELQTKTRCWTLFDRYLDIYRTKPGHGLMTITGHFEDGPTLTTRNELCYALML